MAEHTARRSVLPEHRYDWRVASVTVVVGILGIAAMAVAARVIGSERFGLVLDDPLGSARNGHDLGYLAVGWVSHFGVMMWAFAAMSGLAAARLRWSAPGQRRLALMFAGSGLLSVGLMADDLFQLHENVIPRVLDVSEKRPLLGWALLGVAWFIAFAGPLLRNRYFPLVVVAGVALVTSMLIDVLGDAGPLAEIHDALGGAGVTEDGTKLVGILAWAVFHWRAGIASLARRSGHEEDAGAARGSGYPRLPVSASV